MLKCLVLLLEAAEADLTRPVQWVSGSKEYAPAPAFHHCSALPNAPAWRNGQFYPSVCNWTFPEKRDGQAQGFWN